MNLKDLLFRKASIEREITSLVSRIEPELRVLKERLSEVEGECLEIALAEGGKAMAAQGKDSGTTNMTIDGVGVKFVVGKKVEWNQDGLRDLYFRIMAHDEVPEDYMEVSYSVKENNFKAFPPKVKAIFSSHRTVKPTKPRVEFGVVDDDDSPPF